MKAKSHGDDRAKVAADLARLMPFLLPWLDLSDIPVRGSA
jgi:hypothetical protein